MACVARARAILTQLAGAYAVAAAIGFPEPRLKAGADRVADGRVRTLVRSALVSVPLSFGWYDLGAAAAWPLVRRRAPAWT
jgi:hypothetical protein